MKPLDHAKDWFGSTFYEILDYYLDRGYVYSGPEAFGMALPHNKDLLMRSGLNKELDKCDCWYIQYVAGDIGRLLQLLSDLPHDFKWIVFNRDDGDYKAYDLKKLMEKFNGKEKRT